MLAFKRKPMQSFVIQVPGMKPITVQVTRCSESSTTIAVDAQTEVRIIRSELLRGNSTKDEK